MARHFGEKRDPSFGIWKPENADLDVEAQDPLTWGSKSPTRDRMPVNPEDELIELIDKGPLDDQAEDRFVPASPTDEVEQYADYGLGGSDLEVDEGKSIAQQNTKQTLRRDKFDESRAQKRYLSPEQKSRDALIKRNRKEVMH